MKTCRSGLHMYDGGKFRTCPDCFKSSHTAYYQNNKESIKQTSRETRSRVGADNLKNVQLNARFGINIEAYSYLLLAQGYVCNICKNPETLFDKSANRLRLLSVDHCHATGRIRGLLCHHCNHGLGNFSDSTELLKQAIRYLGQ